MHEYSTFLLHSFIATPIVTLLTKTFLSSLCAFLYPIANHALFVDRVLPLLADALDEVEPSQITSELVSDSAVQSMTQRLVQALAADLATLSTACISSQTQEAGSMLKEALLSLHILNTLNIPSGELLSAAEKMLRRCVKEFQPEVSKPCVVRKKPGKEAQMMIAEIVRFLLAHSVSYDVMETLVLEVLEVFHSYPLILSSIADSYHHLPDSSRTEAKLVVLMNKYACYLNSPQHTVRRSWLRLFLAFQQCDVGPPVFDDV